MEASDETLRAIFDQAAVGIAQIGLDGSWLRVNNRYCQMLGYSESELRTKTLHDITHSDDCNEVLAGRRQLLEGTISSHSMEKRYIRRDGTVFWGRLNRSLVRDSDNLPRYFIAVVEDITEKMHAERALRDRERQLVLAQNVALLGLWESDLRTGVTVTSGEYLKLYGLTPDQLPLAHEQWLQLVHPGDRERMQQEYQESLERTHVWDTEFRVVWPDGSVHWLLSKGQVIVDDAGCPVRLAGVSFDITERKQAEEVRSHLAAIVESSGDAIIGETLQGEIVSWNPGAEKIYGYKAEEMIGQPISLLVPPDRPDEIPQILERLRQGGRFEHYETTRVRKDGGRIEISVTISPIRDGTGAVVGACAIARDITEQKLAEAALRESEERFRNMADTAPVMIWVAGPDKRATFFNKCCLDFSGHSLEQKLGDGWAAALHPADRDQFLAVFSSSIDSRQEFRAVVRLRRADEEYRWVLSTGVPRISPDGTFLGFIGSCLDITDLRRTQEEALARQKLEDLGVLASGIAHDFNNLLGGILAETELVEADLTAGLSPHEEIARIKTVAIRGAEIVRELMIYAGQDQAGVCEPVDLSRLTAEMLELIKISISKHAVLKSNLDKNAPAVWGNASQLRQVLMNLVINASEAIGEKEGVIQVITSRVPAGDYVRLEVSDSGCGLTDEAKTKIFDPFFTTKFAGRGLGLAVVQGIVRAHGGAIDVESAPGYGATFRVLLPCAPTVQNVVESSTAELVHTASRTGGTVLVVEDEEVLRLAVAKALRRRGFSVMEAKDGSVAIDMMRTHRDDIDVMLLDFTLPGTSSREVFEEAQRLRGDLKVVLSSAYDKKTVHTSFAGLPITQFIRKPFQLDDLAGTLRDALAS